MNIPDFVQLRQNIIKQIEKQLDRKLTDEEWFICSNGIVGILKELA